MEIPEIKTTNTAYHEFIKKDMWREEELQMTGEMKTILINVLPAMKEFYSIIALDSLTTPKLIPFKPSHEEWSREFREYMEFYFSALSRVLYDYTVSAVFLELRHQCKSNMEFIDFMAENSDGRKRALSYLKYYNPDGILRAGIKSFNPPFNCWKDGYGGEPWYQIAKAGLMYHTLPTMVFIDHCNDLSHNNGIYYDKECNILSLNSYNCSSLTNYLNCEHDFADFLDFKRDCTNPIEMLRIAQTYTLQKLIIKAKILGLIKIYNSSFNFFPSMVPYGLSRKLQSPSNNLFYGSNSPEIRELSMGEWELDDMLKVYHSPEYGDDDLSTHKIEYYDMYDECGYRVEVERRRRRA